MRLFALLSILTLHSIHLVASEQYILRFDTQKSHRFVMTGCYGTASYNWIAVDTATLKNSRSLLLDYANDQVTEETLEEELWAWTNKKGAKAGTRIAVNLETGAEEAVSEVFGHRKALVFCRCKNPRLKDCDLSGRLGPLVGIPSFYVITPKPSER